MLTRAFFLKEYVIRKKSINQIAKEKGIDWQTIKRYAKENKIKLRSLKEQAKFSSKGAKPKYEKILTKQFLVKNYLKRKKSIKEIAKELGIYRGTVARYLKKFKIRTRTTKEQMEISYPPKEFKLTQEALSFLDGLLLGDGSIPQNKYNARSYTQVCKYREYLEYVKERLKKFGIEVSPIRGRWINDIRCKKGGYKEYFLQTKRYKTFDKLRKRWYNKRGRKIIPKDIILTPDCLLQFYLCDGNYYREIRLCTSGFKLNDVKFLKKLIEKRVGISLRLITSPSLKGGADIAIKKSEVPKFLRFIGKSPVKCYKYKWIDGELRKNGKNICYTSSSKS